MFFNSNKENLNDTMKLLDDLKLFLKSDINSLPLHKRAYQSQENQIVYDKICEIASIVKEQKEDEILMYGEVILSAEKLSDGYSNDRVTRRSNNRTLSYLAKTLNSMNQTIEDSLKNIITILKEYDDNNFSNHIDETLFRGGELQSLIHSFNALRDKIVDILKQDKMFSDSLGKLSNDLNNSMNALSTITDTQVEHIERISSSINTASTNIDSITEDANNMEKNGHILKTTINSKKEIATSTALSMDEINQATTQVIDFIEVIEQIAFQTNILSLNAAVEAATAGEAGKGFAVVAQEVRNLANKSADSAKQIKELTQALSDKTVKGKTSVEDMVNGYEELDSNVSTTLSLIEKVTSQNELLRENIKGIEKSAIDITKEIKGGKSATNAVKEVSLEIDTISNKILDSIKDKKF
jgi:methyl-accepting chemotaxis protein